MTYVGRFAPSPTGPLHAGSLVAALASWLDARAHGGRWLVRIEDVDRPRCVPSADRYILTQLAACGLIPDQAPVWQSQRGAHYQAALDDLTRRGLAYPCVCSRQDIAVVQARLGIARQRGRELPYPGTCRPERGGPSGQPPYPAKPAMRLHTGRAFSVASGAGLIFEAGQTSPGWRIDWQDRRLGAQWQNVTQAVGDFVLRRADGLWAYQLAVVVDDAAQDITHIVRGEDLTDNTPRQILLQHALGLSTPAYLHTPLVLGTNGEKLSKQNGAPPLKLPDARAALAALNGAARALGLPPANAANVTEALAMWTQAWAEQCP
ncbi:MAG: tRNA glutamyl-Q(34) synthetase GluQRS [Burkholderiaceae bacterium]|jgi:glutamyl-Q tRNA(Asp) synthetase|nr:tRNA glutamyl-Q(34) synthetase GluQRS [Burkholderiaceae bacterium]